MQNPPSEFQIQSYEDEIDLTEILLTMWKYKTLIFAIFILSIILAIVYKNSLLPTYTSKATILNMLDREFTKIATDSQYSLRINVSKNQFLMSILNSSSLAEKVAEKGNFIKKIYPKLWDEKKQKWILKKNKKIPDIKIAALKLKKMIKVEAGEKKGATIAIKVTSHSPKLSAEIVNTYIEALQIFLKENTFTAAKKNRLFLESQLEKYKKALEKSQSELKEFLNTHHIYNLEKQIETSIEAFTKQTILLEQYKNELNLIKSLASEKSPKVIAIRKKIAITNQNISNLKGDEKNREAEKENSLIKLNQVSFLRQEHKRIKKEIEINEKFYNMFLESHKKQLINEAKNDIYITVLDKAFPPKKPNSKAKHIIFIAGIAGIFMGIFISFMIEFFNNIKKKIESKTKADKNNELL